MTPKIHQVGPPQSPHLLLQIHAIRLHNLPLHRVHLCLHVSDGESLDHPQPLGDSFAGVGG